MGEITRHNFEDMFPKIEHAINSADFIALDTEFTGLAYSDACKRSLFDTSTERYAKLRKSVEKFTLSQIGLTIFTGSTKENKYTAETYHFYLCPLPFGSNDQRFCLQASCIQFLCKHKFDFNKWFYQGLPFLNQVQEKQMMGELEGGLLFAGIEREVDEYEVQSLCSYVAAWLPTSKVGDFLTLSMKDGPQMSLYVYHNDLRRRFPQIWTSTDAFNQIVVERVDQVKRQLMEKQNKESEKNQWKEQLNQMLGFTRVFRLLQHAKKPIIGHNLMMELVYMYHKFHRPLPESYSTFKKEMHRVFPVIFDTKHIHYCLKKPLESLELFKAGSLEALFNKLNSPEVMTLTLLQPSIHHSTEHRGEADHPHDAGYDAYMCGCVFLRFCHLLHFRSINSADVEPCPFKNYFTTMKKYRNKINVIRAMVDHISLEGNEAPCQRPPLLYVEARKSGVKLVSQQLAVWFSFYGTVDVQMISSHQAIVATANFMTARDIVHAFKSHDCIKVTKYRFWEHSKIGQGIVYGSLAVATGTCAFIVYNILR